jgi:hypothetical protein
MSKQVIRSNGSKQFFSQKMHRMNTPPKQLTSTVKAAQALDWTAAVMARLVAAERHQNRDTV